MQQNKRNNGCVTAVIIMGVILVVALIHLGIAFYFLASRFKEREVHTHNRASSASSAPTVPDLAELPPPVLVTHGRFVRDAALRFRGQYPVTGAITVGKYRLTRLAIASDDDLAAFEAAKGPVMTPPLMLAFAEAVPGEDGQEIQVPLTLDSYRLTRDGIDFAAHSPQLGAVAFNGNWADARFLRVLNDPERTPGYRDSGVIIGDLTVAGTVYKAADFGYMIQ